MKSENIWKLLARKMTGEATVEELMELEDLLRDDPEMKYTAETFCRLWNALLVQSEENGTKKSEGDIKEEHSHLLKEKGK